MSTAQTPNSAAAAGGGIDGANGRPVTTDAAGRVAPATTTRAWTLPQGVKLEGWTPPTAATTPAGPTKSAPSTPSRAVVRQVASAGSPQAAPTGFLAGLKKIAQDHGHILVPAALGLGWAMSSRRAPPQAASQATPSAQGSLWGTAGGDEAPAPTPRPPRKRSSGGGG